MVLKSGLIQYMGSVLSIYVSVYMNRVSTLSYKLWRASVQLFENTCAYHTSYE